MVCHYEGAIGVLRQEWKMSDFGVWFGKADKKLNGFRNKKTQPTAIDIDSMNQIHNTLCILHLDYGSQIHFQIGDAPSAEILRWLSMVNL